MPTIAPLALMSQYGANKPENAGTKYTPPESSTLPAKYSVTGASSTSFKLSRSHWIAAPAIAIEPSRA